MTIIQEQIPAIHVLLRYLEAEGIEYVFGIPGGPISSLYQAIFERNKIQHILAKHEEGAAFMAYGYARVRGGLAVCCTTTGPGGTNALTGIACAHAASVPVMLLTAQIASKAFGKGALQDSTEFGVDLVQIFKPVTKASTMLQRSEQMPEIMRRLLRTALTGRPGPVHLNLPADLVKKEIPYIPIPPAHYRPHTAIGDREAIQEAARLLLEAESPCLFVGQGVHISGAWEELMSFAVLLQIPVVTSPMAKGIFPEDHPLSLGVFGFAGHPRAEAFLLSGRVDVLVAIGTSFSELSTNAWDHRLQPSSALIHIDIDPNEIGKNYSADIGIVGDAKAVLREFCDVVKGMMTGWPAVNGDHIARFKTEVPRFHVPELMTDDRVPLKPPRVVKEMQDLLPKGTLLFVDSGNCFSWTGMYYEVREPGTYYCDTGLASMGLGLVASLGGKLAAPERHVVAIGGDAAFAMNGTEIHTAVEHNIPVIWIILNNGGHGMVYHGDQLLLNRRLGSTVFHTPLDIAGMATALGARGFKADSHESFRTALREALASKEPCVIDTIIDPEEMPVSLPSRVATLREFFNGTLGEHPRSLRAPWLRAPLSRRF